MSDGSKDLQIVRSMRLRRSGNRGIVRRKQRSGNGGRSTSSNWKPPLNTMKNNCRVFSRATDLQQMSVLCSDTRILSWSASCLRKVRSLTPHVGGVQLIGALGVDVQSELKMKTEASHILPHPGPSGHAQPSPVQRAVMNRQGQPRRSASGSTTKPIRPHGITSHPPPRIQPTPPAQTMSPASSNSPHMSGKTVPRSSNGDPKSHKPRQQQIDPRQQPYPGTTNMHMSSLSNNSTTGINSKKPGEIGTASNTGTYYPSSYQTHIEQLGEQFPHLAKISVNVLLVASTANTYSSSQSKSMMHTQICFQTKIRAKIQSALQATSSINKLPWQTISKFQWVCKVNLQCITWQLCNQYLGIPYRKQWTPIILHLVSPIPGSTHTILL